MTVGITELPPEGMQLGGVALAGDAERGTKTTEGLSLLFTTAGITVQGPQPQIERLLVWTGLDSASCREKIVLPDGRNAAVMELTSGGQSIRFLLPMDTVTPGQAAYLDQALPAWLSRYRGPATSSAPSPSASAPEPPSSGTSNGGSGAAAAGAAAAGAAGAAAASAANGSTPGASETVAASPPTMTPPSSAASATPPSSTASAPPPSTAGEPLPPPPGSAPPPPPPPPRATGATGPGQSIPAPGQNVPAPGPGLPATGSHLPPPGPGVPAPAGTPGSSGPAPAGTSGWDVASSTLPAGVAWAAQPTDGGASADAGAASIKKTRGWRKAKAPASTPVAPGAAAPVAPPGAVAPMPPSEPPANPVPLRLDTPLPPPPPEPPGGADAGPVVWKPPIDPASGVALWDQTQAPADVPAPKNRGRRKGSKADAAVAAGAVAGVGVAASPPPPSAPFSVVETAAATSEPARKNNRTALVVLLVVLLLVIGGIAYFAVSRNSNTPTTTPPAPSPSPAAVDATLAASINLHLTDLPAGWALSTAAATAGQSPRPPLAPPAAQVRANQALASCLGQPLAVVTGLFDNGALPDQIVAVRSPTFANGTDPGIQMSSDTTVLQTDANAQALTAPFAAANFATCYGQYQSALAAAAVAGSTAQVQPVQLSAPAGVTSFGYLTTLTIPNLGTQVIGQAFMIGGRIESVLEPTTNGPQVPSAPFTAAYDAMTGRIAQATSK